jgi:small basic protein
LILLIPVIAILAGVVLAKFFVGPVTGPTGPYLAVACMAGLDSVCGGIRSGLEGKFRNDVFVTGFFSNVIIAFFLAYLGDRLVINLYLGVALVLGSRIFTNLSLIRRILLTKLQDTRERERLQQAQKQSSAAEAGGTIA